MKILIAYRGDGWNEVEPALKKAGHELVHISKHTNTAADIGELLDWTCLHAESLYLGPGWRRCVIARALRAVAIAAGIPRLGFE